MIGTLEQSLTPIQPEINSLDGFDVVGAAELILSDQVTVESPADAFDFDFSLSAEANELAYDQVMALQDLDILGLLDHDAGDEASAASAQRVMDAINHVNLTAETLSTEGIISEIARRQNAFTAMMEQDRILRSRAEEADDDEDRDAA